MKALDVFLWIISGSGLIANGLKFKDIPWEQIPSWAIWLQIIFGIVLLVGIVLLWTDKKSTTRG